MEVLAIYDRESSFASRLAEMMNDDAAFPYFAEVFSEETALVQALEEGRINLLVADKPAWDEMPRKNGAGRVIVWSDVPGYSCIDGVPAVYKYQSAKQIQEEILKICAEEKTALTVGTESVRTKYIGVVSPVGRSFKTSFSVALGQLLSERGKVLYLTLEPYAAHEVFFGKEPEFGFSNLLYVWSTAGKGLGRFTEDFHGLSILPPTEFPEDLYRTEPVQIKQMIMDLVAEEGYDLVILELGMEHRLLEMLLPMLHKVYVPSRDDAVSECKVQEFMRWAGRIDEQMYRKAEKIIIPGNPVIPGGVSQAEQILWGSVGDYVRTMLSGMY